jgi:hypothetical protein
MARSGVHNPSFYENPPPIEISCTVDGGGVLIPVGLKASRPPFPYNARILSWSIMTDQVTNLTWDVWKANGAIPVVANSITAAAKPSVAAARFGSSSVLTGWTTLVAPGDIFAFNLDVNSAATWVTLILDFEVL